MDDVVSSAATKPGLTTNDKVVQGNRIFEQVYYVVFLNLTLAHLRMWGGVYFEYFLGVAKEEELQPR